MDYAKAIKCFETAAKHTSASKDPVLWNLACGLSELSKAIEGAELLSPVHELSERLERIEQALLRLQQDL